MSFSLHTIINTFSYHSDLPEDYYTNKTVSQAVSIDFYVKEEFTEGIFDSCDDVYNPASDTTAVEFMCGSLGPLCNAKRWFDFMGASVTDGGLAPFTIRYKYEENTTIINNRNVTPFTDVLMPCDESVSNRIQETLGF